MRVGGFVLEADRQRPVPRSRWLPGNHRFSDGIEFGLLFLIVPLHRAKPGVKDLARVGILATLDLSLNKLIHLLSEADGSARA